MALADYPQWVLEHKRPGTEIRFKDGRFYLYECSSFYDKEKKKTRKKTGKYLGTITEADGFVAARRRMVASDSVDETGSCPSVSTVTVPPDIKDGQVASLEYGFYHFYENVLAETYVPLLKKHFPDCWQTIVAMSYCRAMFQSPLNRMHSDFRKSYMSVILKDARLSARHLTGFIRDLGQRRADVVAFCQEFCEGLSNIIFDGTDIISASRLMSINKYSKTKTGTYDELFNVMCAFSVDLRCPVYYHILPGNMKDVSAFCDTLETLLTKKDQTMVVIDPESESALDKGFASERNFSKMEEKGLTYVVGIRRNDSHLDYGCLSSRDNSGMDGQFEYEGRCIWYKRLGIWNEQHPQRAVYLYYDEELAHDERYDFVRHHEGDIGKIEYTEAYRKAALKFGTIGMVTNGNKSGEEVYCCYKNRCQVENEISTLKTVVGADTTYMQDEVALEGWMFPNYLALHWHYRMRNLLVDKDLIRKLSSRALFHIFTGVRKIQIGGLWKLAGIIKADQKVLKKIGLLPEMDAKYLALGAEADKTEE